MKLFLFALLSLPLSTLANGGLPTQPYIYVEGKAEIEKPPDLVTLRFEVVAHNAAQANANQEVQATAGKIFAMLNDKKIAQKDVIADDIRSQPEYQNDENTPRSRGKLVGYSVTRPFAVNVRDIPAFAKLVDELISMAGVEFSRIEIGLSEESGVEDLVWARALANAHERAEKTLKAIGMKIDSVFAVSPESFPLIESKIFGTSVVVTGSAIRSAQEVGPSQYRLAPVAVNQSVHVIYLISPAK